MSLAVVHTRAKLGIEAPQVTVEVHLSNGLPSLSIVGLPETAVKESKDRVRSAILNSQFEFPARRITVNLAPADLPKEGGRFDLAIALGILAASDQIPAEQLEHYEALGELALSGELRPVNGCLPAAIASSHAGRKLILPCDNALEAALCKGAEILQARSLLTVCAHLQQRELLPVTPHAHLGNTQQRSENDLRDIKGQAHAKRALEIAAKVLSVFVFCTALLPANATEIYQAKVIGVTDGDTIKVLRTGNKQVKIRLAGIDCPERKQPWGTKAKQAASDLVAGQTVTIEKLTTDRYGRTIGRVFANGLNVNRSLVEGGNCWVYPRYAKDKVLFTLQDQAQTAGLGLWALPQAERVPPWQWRKIKK